MSRQTKINTAPLENVVRDIRRGLRTGGSATPVRGMLRKWGTRYLGEMQRRAKKFSRGGGDWAPLKVSTIKSRRKGRGKSKRSPAILSDTNTLISSLRRGAAGNLFKDIKNGIRVGFGETRHPSGKATVADIARFHHKGAGNLPKRELLVPPGPATRRGMLQDAKTAYKRMFDQHAIRGAGI